MDGLLVVDKPAGPTSHDVVARVRRVLGERRIGHTGTLDPLASGVLALVVGRATRLAQFMGGDSKSYDARIQLGLDTDTYDAEGSPSGAPFTGRWPDQMVVEEAIEALRGTRLQRPPAFSAKKIGGRRSYALARKRSGGMSRHEGTPEEHTGEASPAPAPVEVTLRTCVVNRYADGVLDLSLECSAGFYVRSLAHDLGERLGTGAHLAALRRTRSGAATLGQAIPLADLEASQERARAAVIPMAAMLPALPAVVLTEAGAKRVAHGQAVGLEDLAGPRREDGPIDSGLDPVSPAGGGTIRPEAVRLFSTNGALLAIARPAGHTGALHPSVVLM